MLMAGRFPSHDHSLSNSQISSNKSAKGLCFLSLVLVDNNSNNRDSRGTRTLSSFSLVGHSSETFLTVWDSNSVIAKNNKDANSSNQERTHFSKFSVRFSDSRTRFSNRLDREASVLMSFLLIPSIRTLDRSTEVEMTSLQRLSDACKKPK